MKKLFTLLLLLILPAITMAQGKRNDFYHKSKKVMVYPYEVVKRYESDSIIFQDSIIRVAFEFEYIPLNGVKYLMLDILNRTDERIYVEWENVRLNKNKIKFVLDSSHKKDLKIEDECIIGGESSGYRFIEKDFSVTSSKVENGDIYLRKWGDTDFQVILPIKIGEKIRDYKFNFKFEKYSEEEIDSLYSLACKIEEKRKMLKKGMSRNEVENIMGKPISESIMETNWGSSRAAKFYPTGVKKGDEILSYPFMNVFMRNGVMAKAAFVTKYD